MDDCCKTAFNPDRIETERCEFCIAALQYVRQARDRTPRERRVPADEHSTTHANGATGVAVVHVRALVVPLAALELGGTLGVVPALGESGASVLAFGEWRVELTAGEPAGAFAVTLAGLRQVPPDLAALGIRAEVLPG